MDNNEQCIFSVLQKDIKQTDRFTGRVLNVQEKSNELNDKLIEIGNTITPIEKIDSDVGKLIERTFDMEKSTISDLTTPKIKKFSFSYWPSQYGDHRSGTWESPNPPTGLYDKNVIYNTALSISGPCYVYSLELILKSYKSSSLPYGQSFIRLTLDGKQYVYSSTTSATHTLAFSSGNTAVDYSTYQAFPSSQIFPSSSQKITTPLIRPLYCQNGFKLEYSLWQDSVVVGVYDWGVSSNITYSLI